MIFAPLENGSIEAVSDVLDDLKHVLIETLKIQFTRC